MLDLLLALVVTVVLLIPAGVVLAALLDAAHRPDWVWALAGRSRVVWLGAIVVSGLFVLPGLVVASVYAARVRPHLRAVERGELGPG